MRLFHTITKATTLLRLTAEVHTDPDKLKAAMLEACELLEAEWADAEAKWDTLMMTIRALKEGAGK